VIGFGLALAVGCTQQAAPRVDVDQAKAIAGELRDNKLFAAAIEQYEELLEGGAPDPAQRGTISYLIARIYYEDLKDYDNAAAWYIRARTYDPNGSFVDEAGKNLIAALEKSGRMIDASRQLQTMTDIDAPKRERKSGDEVVARIGSQDIYMSELEERIQALPPAVQQSLTARKDRVDFLRRYVGSELLYRAARREGYDRDPQIKKEQELMLRDAVINRYVYDKVLPGMKIDTVDVRNFYEANKTVRYDDKPYDAVRSQVKTDYQQQKAEAALNEYIQKLIQTEKPAFYDANVR
jgi:tetratricopeptide (TPR) repeat protein